MGGMGAESGVVMKGRRLDMKLKMNPASLPKPELEGERLLIPFPHHLRLPLRWV